MSFRNRCVVAGSNGLVNLSVPLENGRNQRMLMKDTRISYLTDWQTQHLRTIESCYSRSPFFEFYRDGIFGLIGKKEVFLLDKNLSILEWLKKVLKLPADISLTNSYQRNTEPGMVDKRNQFLPKNYVEQSMGFSYRQVFEDRIGFASNLSILDLLFCCGPGAKKLLEDNKLTF